MALLTPGKPGDPGATGRDNRRFVEGVLWIARTGAPWRDLPAELGNWNSTWRRFDRWSARGVRERLFAAMADDPDLSTSSSMPPSSAPTSIVPAEKRG